MLNSLITLMGFCVAAGPTSTRIACPPGTRLVTQKEGSFCVRVAIGKRHGPALFVHGNGRPLAAGRFADGRKEGVWVQWYRSGRVWTRETFRRGLRHGPAEQHHPSGHKAWSGTYRNGLPHGTWQLFDRHGRRTGRGAYRLGSRVGTWTFYHPHLGTKRLEVIHFAPGCRYQAHYDEAGNTNFWVHNVWYGSGVIGGARCLARWLRRGRK